MMLLKARQWLVLTLLCLIQLVFSNNVWKPIDERFQRLVGQQMDWQVEIEIVEPLSDSELRVLKQSKLLRNSYKYIFNIRSKTNLSSFVYKEGIILKGRFPRQISPPTENGPYSNINFSEYVFVFANEYNLLGGGTCLEYSTGLPEVCPVDEVVVWKPSIGTLFLDNPTGYSSANGQPNSLILIYLAGLSPKRLPGLKWDTDLSNANHSVIQAELDDGYVRIWYGRNHLAGVPLKMEIVRGGIREQYETISIERKENVVIVSKFNYLLEQGNYRENMKFSVKNLQYLNEPFHLSHIPKGVLVFDFRHLGVSVAPKNAQDQAIQYRWTGELPSVEEIRNKAYESGRLTPPARPQSRYSLVLFAPALLFFAGALYLYWKQRRR